jgi:hypothetical protein
VKTTYYDVLGVPRNAKLTDITRAYNRHKSEVQRDTAPPDLKRETLYREAFETLGDPERRAAYDASLVEPDRRRRSRLRAVWIGGVGVILAAAGLYYLRPGAPTVPARPVRSSEEILKQVSTAIGRVHSIDISGSTLPVSTAFAVGENTMISSCRGVAPSTQLVVRMPPRELPARVTAVDDALGVCRLAVEGIGSRPLVVSHSVPKFGEPVYAAKVQANGAITLTPGKVMRVVAEPNARAIESMPAGIGGVPLLDGEGQVVAVASGSDGRYVSVPTAWMNELLAPIRDEPPPREETPPVAPPAQPGTVPKTIEDIPPERRAKLEKAFRPPPNVNEDWMK